MAHDQDHTVASHSDTDATGAELETLTNAGDASALHTHAGGGVTDATYLVGAAHAGLSNEIVVGATPGGELGGTWASPTVDGTHSGSAHHDASHTHASHTGIGVNDHHAQAHGDADHTNVTRKRGYVSLFGWTIGTPTKFPNGSTQGVNLLFYVPDDYVSGDITIQVTTRGDSGAGTQNARFNYAGYRFRSAVAFHTWQATVAFTIAGITANLTNVTTITLLDADFQVGDLIRVDLNRLGADGADTYTGVMDYDGAWIEYTAAT